MTREISREEVRYLGQCGEENRPERSSVISRGGRKMVKRRSLIHPTRTSPSSTMCCKISLIGNLPMKSASSLWSKLSTSNQRVVPNRGTRADWRVGDNKVAGILSVVQKIWCRWFSCHEMDVKAEDRSLIDSVSSWRTRAANLSSVSGRKRSALA